MLRLVSDDEETPTPKENSSPHNSYMSHNKVESSESPTLLGDVQLLLALDEEIAALNNEIRSALQRRRCLKGWRQSLLAAQLEPPR